MLKWTREKRRLLPTEPERQIDKPDIPRPSSQIVTIPIRLEHFDIAAAIRIDWFEHPCTRDLTGNIERPTFLYS
jgi:hypothetical protein